MQSEVILPLVVIIVFVHGYQIRTRRPTGGGGELSAAPLADHTINWLQDNIQRIDVQRPLLIAAGSDYIRHGDLLSGQRADLSASSSGQGGTARVPAVR